MMTTMMQCTNMACGRVSLLSQDPLGQISRCRRSCRKLPSACESTQDGQSHLGLGPDDSGEMPGFPIPPAASPSCHETTSTSAAVGSWSSLRAIASTSRPTLNTSLGRFRIVNILGEGEHAVVYRAYDPILERDVALKVPHQAVLNTAKAADRFLGEAKALGQLRHPRIVPVYEAGFAGGQPYIAMALIEGHSLAEQLTECRIPFDRAVEIVAQLAEALAYAHAQGVVHRDIKPANIHVDKHAMIYLMDFGIAYRRIRVRFPYPLALSWVRPPILFTELTERGQTA